MNALKKLSFLAILLSGLAFTACTEESEAIFPDMETTETTGTEGTGGTDTNPDRD